MYNEQATETMLQAVEVVKESAKKAEKEYDRGASEIKRMASRQIQLGVGTAVGKVSDIASKTRRVNDAYYASLQSLVKMLDDGCRPLLSLDPDPSAIRQVWETIKWLNDESEIKTTFTASVNSSNRGDLAAVSYIPTMENKLIQKYWENFYNAHPGKAALEKAEREKEKALRKEREEQAKRIAAQVAAVYEKEFADWSAKREEVLKKREVEMRCELERLKKNRKEDIEARHKESVKKANNAKTFNENTKKHHERALESLGFFAFLKRRDHKEKLGYAIQGLAQANAALEEAERLYREETEGFDAWVERQRAALEETVREKYPLPKKPRKRAHHTDPKKMADEMVKECIYEEMEPGKKYTVEELIELVPILMDKTKVSVLGYLRQMIDVDIERIEEPRAAYFRLIEK